MKDKLIAIIKNLAAASPMNVLSLWIAWLFVALDEAQRDLDEASAAGVQYKAARDTAVRLAGRFMRERNSAREERDTAHEIGWKAIVQRDSLAEDLRLSSNETHSLAKLFEHADELRRMAESREAEAQRALSVSNGLVHGVRSVLECPVGNDVVAWARASIKQMQDENVAAQRDLVTCRSEREAAYVEGSREKLARQNAELAHGTALGRAIEAERVIALIHRESKCPTNNDLFCWVADRLGPVGAKKWIADLEKQLDAAKARADAAEKKLNELVDDDDKPAYVPTPAEVKAWGKAFESAAVPMSSVAARRSPAPWHANHHADNCAACGKTRGIGRSIETEGLLYAVCYSCLATPWRDLLDAIQARAATTKPNVQEAKQ